ncbi:MAG: spermidine/putrescine ABC transporter substrate-binding protein [Pseudomonadota bacterium]
MIIKKCYKLGLIFLISTLLIIGCSKGPDQEKGDEVPGAKKIEGGTLTLYNWEEYIGSNTLENFEKETGIHVNEITFQDEEDMLGAVQSDLDAYDLVVSSDDLVREMRHAKILVQLDYSKIPNFKHIAKKYHNMPCDPEQKYTVPYLTGTTGMVVNKKYIKEDTDSWKVLFDKRYKGKLAMLNNSFEVVAAASKMLGYSINITSPEKIEKVKKLLLEQKTLVQGYYDTETLKDLMIHEKLWAAQIYSGEGLVVADENENLEYVIPKEGAPVWADFFVMPRDAKHKEEAHMFLNYILRPDVNASIASELWYATPNEAAKPLMDPEVLNSKSVYPPAEVMERCEFFKNTGDVTRLIAPIWSDLMIKG